MGFTFSFMNTYYYTEHRENLDDIVLSSKILGLYDLKPRSFGQQFTVMHHEMMEALYFNGTIGFILISMCTIGILGHLFEFISNNMYEFSVQMLCGADEMMIARRVVSQLFIVFIISNGINLFIYKFTHTAWLVLVGSLIFGIILMAYTYLIMHSHTIVGLKRRYQT